MKNYLILFLLLIMIIPFDIMATSGALASDTIKVCPDGKTYGKHTNHWHKAVKKGDRYYASGSALKKDPCPPKSSNNELSSLMIDGEKIWVYYNMNYETYNKKISIKAVASDSKAKVSTDYKELFYGKNTIHITVTAENGEKNVYTLVVTLLEPNIFLKSLTINDDNIDISSDMTYITYDKDIIIDAVPNNTDIKVSNNYKSLDFGENKIVITLSDNYGNRREYHLTIILKKQDSTLKSLKIDNNEMEITDNITYETYNKNIVIEAIPNDSNVKVSQTPQELVIGNNEIIITLLDENNNKTEYKINVILKENTISLDYLSIDNEIIDIQDEMTYETYNDDIIIDARSNDESIIITNDYNGLVIGNNIITITLIDNYDNKKEYKLNVIKQEKIDDKEENTINDNVIIDDKEENKNNENNENKEVIENEDDNDSTSLVVGGLGTLALIGGGVAMMKKKH